MGVVFDNALQARELAAVVQRDQRHALRRATEFADLRDAGSHQHAAVCDQHDLVGWSHQRRCHHLAIALALHDRDHALAAAQVAGVLDDVGALAETVFGRRQHTLFLVLGHQHRDHALAVFEVHAANATCLAA